jgi:GTP-binding protein
MATFIDQTLLHVRAGSGGNGCTAFRREKFVPHGGPSGGDGGDGGSVYLVGDARMNTLYHLRFQNLYSAERGEHGKGANRTGRTGEDLLVAVPLGTQVFEAEGADTETPFGEVLADGERLLLASGGRGGRGNARFATSTNQAPRRSDPGTEGEEKRLRLELKLLADVGVVGLPNAGKSTLISVVSAARPKIADYPFTTLVPQLGVAVLDRDSEPFVIADLPGLIAGAAQGAGLGIQFLRHVERCRVLLHLVDLSAEGGAAEDFATVERELGEYNAALLERPRLVVGSKSDAALPERREALRAAAAERGLPYFEISSATHTGVRELVAELTRRLRPAAPAPE